MKKRIFFPPGHGRFNVELLVAIIHLPSPSDRLYKTAAPRSNEYQEMNGAMLSSVLKLFSSMQKKCSWPTGLGSGVYIWRKIFARSSSQVKIAIVLGRRAEFIGIVGGAKLR